jgi:hypothetical protein
MSADQLSFVSVVFEMEYPLLTLQARSIATYVSPELVAEIIIIDNSAHGMSPARSEQILSEYGALRSIVRVLRPDDIVRVPGADGWRSQQVLKLYIVDQLSTNKYVVLDAKNHFVNHVARDFFVAPDGRSRVNSYSYRTHPLRPNLENVLRYLGLDPANFLDNYTATVTPFVLDSQLVRELITGIDKRSGRTLAREFLTEDLTEFFLYTAWIISSGRPLAQVFDFHQVFCPVVWPRGANAEGVAKAITSAKESRAPLFSVHRRALGVLDEASSTLLAEWWTSRSLFGSVREAATFISEYQLHYRRTARAQRRRDFPRKLIGAWRGLKRRIRRAPLAAHASSDPAQ